MINKEEMIALRKARAEIEDRYNSAREEALDQMCDKMCEDRREYTASELADITGLSKSVITKRIRNNWSFEKNSSVIIKKYAELDHDGVPMMDKIHKRTYWGRTYKVREDSSIMASYNEKHRPAAPKEETNPTSIGGAMVKAMIEKYSGACEE